MSARTMIERRAAWVGEPSADKSGQLGLLLAAAAHVLLFGLLSLARAPQPPRAWPEPTPMDVSLVTEVTPEAQAPAAAPPAPSIAPETGPPEEAAPAPAPAPAAATPPEPAKSTPAKPLPVKPAPQPAVKPVPAPKPAPVKPAPLKPAPLKPVPAARPQTAARPTAAKPTTARSAPIKSSAAARPSRLAGVIAGVAAGSSPAATASRQRGHRLGDNFLAGLSADAPARAASPAAPAARVGAYPTASIVGAIARQIQPCADRQVNPGPGASRILTTLNIRLNPDGTLAATPTKVRQSGVDDENDRYAQRVVDLGIAAFKGCTPLHLPAEYYQTANGGWSTINYRWQLR